ncbi:putative DNA-binding protein BIN4-like isoform X2 [Sesbania bispinosa]|nr:putative DNA-binding protein BIN4-like isoform X2 [Sesbania bispinosa]
MGYRKSNIAQLGFPYVWATVQGPSADRYKYRGRLTFEFYADFGIELGGNPGLRLWMFRKPNRKQSSRPRPPFPSLPPFTREEAFFTENEQFQGKAPRRWLRSFQFRLLISKLYFLTRIKLMMKGRLPSHQELQRSTRTRSTTPGGSRAKSSSRKTLEAASLKLEDQTPSRKKNLDKQKGNKEETKIVNESNIDEHIEHKESFHSIWTLSSDSESFHDHSPKKEDHTNHVETSPHQISQFQDDGECGDELVLDNDGKSPSKKASKEKSPAKKASKEKSSQKQIDVDGHTPVKGKKKDSAKGKGGDGDVEVEAEETLEKLAEPNVSSSRLPLMLSEKVHRTKALIECQGDSIDLSGDMGAVGRIIISDSPCGDQEMYLDLKGTIYKTSIVPCQTFCVVSFGQSEAKIEAVMNDFIQLKPQSNVYEAETMVEGTLDGFFFDSDEEAGKMLKAAHQSDQNEHAEEQAHGKSRGRLTKHQVLKRKEMLSYFAHVRDGDSRTAAVYQIPYRRIESL